MKLKLLAAGIVLACAGSGVATTGASAQDFLNLSGKYTCVQGCLQNSPGPAFITQNGWTMNLVDEIGQPSRGWIDRPGHLWTEEWHQGATYSPDGSTITFDSGTVWQIGFAPPPPPPPVVIRRHIHRHYIRPIQGS